MSANPRAGVSAASYGPRVAPPTVPRARYLSPGGAVRRTLTSCHPSRRPVNAGADHSSEETP
jgi:hypothetical protein